MTCELKQLVDKWRKEACLRKSSHPEDAYSVDEIALFDCAYDMERFISAQKQVEPSK